MSGVETSGALAPARGTGTGITGTSMGMGMDMGVGVGVGVSMSMGMGLAGAVELPWGQPVHVKLGRTVVTLRARPHLTLSAQLRIA